MGSEMCIRDSFDTLGEVAVVFTAMIAVLLLLLRREEDQEIDREK